ncbi:MAG TPA: response regulator, partial [Polyangiaceae bacterium]|nr:response regulator [Polyangiaceae bacterium]
MAIKVLVVDDSALVRKLLTEIISRESDLSVIGSARDPYEARDKIKELNPDVLTLDVEMPRMDGLTFLQNLMRLRPMPVVMVSSLTERGADVTMAALEAGAIDFVTKPQTGLHEGLVQLASELCEKLRVAARANVFTPKERKAALAEPTRAKETWIKTTDRVIAIGASTGGVPAVQTVMRDLAHLRLPVVVVQHMPPVFTRQFADRLNGKVPLRVSEAVAGDAVTAGR